ncbi:MAG: adenine-specific methyltransferase EcoRI family protein, partial [Bacillota bacterium]
MAKTNVLQKSKTEKNDEFYTLWEDIAAELPLYKDQFRGKRIICPCDWDESYNEELVYRDETFIEPSTLLDTGGTIKRIDIGKTKDKIEKDLNLIRCNFVKFLVAHADS